MTFQAPQHWPSASCYFYASVTERFSPEKEVIGILEDAIAAHRNAPADDGMTKTHDAVAALIQGIIDGGNSVRRPHIGEA